MFLFLTSTDFLSIRIPSLKKYRLFWSYDAGSQRMRQNVKHLNFYQYLEHINRKTTTNLNVKLLFSTKEANIVAVPVWVRERQNNSDMSTFQVIAMIRRTNI